MRREDGLILAFVAPAAIVALGLLGTAVTTPFSDVMAQGFGGGSGSS